MTVPPVPPSPPAPPKPRWRRGRVLGGLGAVLAAAVVAVVLVLTLSSGPDRPAPSSSPTKAPSASPVPTGVAVPRFDSGTPTADQAQVLAGRVGFGGGVTGGAGGQVVHVDTAADSGPGSLRAALAGDPPRWIVFDRDLTLRLGSALAVGSNKTIDGRGHRIEIEAPGHDGLDLVGVHNVLVESLVLHDFGDVARTANNDKPDAIHLERARGVWIDHTDLSMAGDKLVAVSDGSSGITVSWCHFHDQEQTFQVGNQATAAADAVQSVTVHHNFFDRTGYRNPVVSYGRAHVYDNYYLDWHTYAVRSERAAQLTVQDNVFDAGTNQRASVVTVGGDGCNDNHTRCDDRAGLLKATGNLLLDGAKLVDHDPAGVVDPARYYRYATEPASRSLAAKVAAGAGPLD